MSKAASQRNERILNDLRTTVDGNNICADCSSPQPRWASWNLGIFLCVKCATIHRSLGTHLSKVKSLTLDTWTKEQVDAMRLAGNVRSNQIYNPDKSRNPPPLNIEGDERDSQLQQYIEKKYRDKAFMRPVKKVEVDGRRSERGGQSEFAKPKAATPQTPTFAFSSGSERSASPDQLQATRSSRLAPQNSGFAQGGNQISRAATAPIPIVSRSTTPVVPVNPYNPFNRSMTASVGLPASGYPSPAYAAPQAPLAQQSYVQQNLSPYTQPTSAQVYSQQQIQTVQQQSYLGHTFQQPQQQQVQQQSQAQQWIPQSQIPSQAPVPQSQTDIWGDLAGLSLSSTSSSFSPAQTSPYPAYQHQQAPVSSFSSQQTGTNPFLRSNTYPQAPSSFQPSSSVSTLGSSSLVPAFQPQSQFGMQNFGSGVGRNPFLNNSTSTNGPAFQPSVGSLGSISQQQQVTAPASYFGSSAYQ